MLSNRSSVDDPLSLVLRTIDSTAAGSTETFLTSRLWYTQDQFGQEICIVEAGGEQVGVMMGWERDISMSSIISGHTVTTWCGSVEATVHKLCDHHKSASQGLKVLNIGFGLGMARLSDFYLILRI